MKLKIQSWLLNFLIKKIFLFGKENKYFFLFIYDFFLLQKDKLLPIVING